MRLRGYRGSDAYEVGAESVSAVIRDLASSGNPLRASTLTAAFAQNNRSQQ